MTHREQIAVVGAGATGRIMALALATARGVRVPVRLYDAAATGAGGGGDIRTLAIAAGTRRMLETLGVWAGVADAAQACTGMDIADGRLEEAIRPALLAFEAEAGTGEPVVHFVPAAALEAAVAARCEEAGIEIAGGQALTGFEATGTRARLSFGDREETAALAVGADGARSAVRRLARLGEVGWAYDQTAVVAVVGHEAGHGGRAVQHFLPGGPLALLPLPGDRSGIVWTLPTAEARATAALAPAAFAERLFAAAGPERGRFETLQGPGTHPLELGLARRYVAPAVALVGDAAHRFHPLAGQGLNIGLRDAAALAEVAAEALRRGEEPGSLAVLERYQRWRRFDAVQFAVATDLLNRLFATGLPGVRTLRDVGLGLVGRLPWLKAAILREAAGSSGARPRLLDGEPV